MLKIGVLGAGYLGRIHIKCIQNLPEYELVGFFDSDNETAKKTSKDFNLTAFKTIDELIDAVDVVDIVTPTVTHYEYATRAIKTLRNVFIEKPVTTTPQEAKSLISISREAGVKVQVGHVERFNPAFTSVYDKIRAPVYIEGHRLSAFNLRSADISVVMDLMVHDIDIVLHIIKSKARNIHTRGIRIISDTIDFANALIEFDNDAVANLTASRISSKNTRTMSFFNLDSFIYVDFLEKKSEITQFSNILDETQVLPSSLVIDLGKKKGKKQIINTAPEIKSTNAIEQELKSFYKSIMHDKEPEVSILDGYHVLDLANSIQNKIYEKINFLEL